MTAARKLNQSL